MTTAAQATTSTDWKTFVRAEPQVVYAAFASAEGHDSWWTDGATLEPWPGGALRLPWDSWEPERAAAEMAGIVTEARPGERFCFRWNAGEPAQPVSVELTFAAHRGGTAVRLVEYGYPDTPQGQANARRSAAGWGEALTLAKFYVEHGIRY